MNLNQVKVEVEKLDHYGQRIVNDDASFLKLSAVRAGPTAYQLPPYPEN